TCWTARPCRPAACGWTNLKWTCEVTAMTDKRSSLCRRPGRWLMAAVPSLGSSLALAPPFQRVTARYAAAMQHSPANGEAVPSRAQTADGTWSLNFQASMFVARLTEESTLRLEGEEVVPLTYRYQRKGLGRSRETTQQFDWANGEVRGVHKKEEFTLPTQPG